MRAINQKEKLGAWIENNPIPILVAALLVTAAALHYAQGIEMKGMETESFVGKESELYQKYDHLYMERFGTESIVVVVEGDDITTPEVLKAMDRLARHMEGVPGVISVSGISQMVLRAEASNGSTAHIPDYQERIDQILAEVDQGMLSIIMPDRRHTIVGIEIPTTMKEAESERIQKETQEMAYLVGFPPNIGTTITGSPALGMAIKNEMAKSNAVLLAVSGLLMVLALLLVFNHVNWPLLPLPTVFLGIIWTFGIMGYFHIPMTMISMSAFPILIGIGIDYAIQFQSRIDEELSRGGTVLDAVTATVSHTAPAVFIALTITAAGFVSLFTSSVPMVRDFGLLCLIGLVMCYLSALFVEITILYLAQKGRNRRQAKKALESDSPLRAPDINTPQNSAPEQPRDEQDSGSWIGSNLEGLVEISLGRWQMVLLIALLLSLAGTYSDTLVPVDTDFKNYLPQDLPPLVEYRHLNDIFGGSDEINIIVQGGDITDPRIMRWIDDFGTYLTESRQQIYGATSIATFVKMYHGGQIPDTNTDLRETFDSIPAIIREKYTDGHDTALIDLNIGQAIRDLGEEGIDRLLIELDKDRIWFGPEPGIFVTITGDPVVMTTVIDALTTGRTQMTLLGLVLIFFILLIIYRDLVKAIVPVLPMLVVIGWMGGVMYATGMSYTPLTATLGALILGVGSEYAILMMERFYEELGHTRNCLAAMKRTSASIGSALMASGMTTVFGFAALMASPFIITSNFGVITVMAVVFALVTTFTVFPVLLIRLEMRRQQIKKIKHKITDLRRPTL